MAVDEKQASAFFKRHEQIKRWEGSETNLQSVIPKRDKTAVKFQDGTVFLAACSSGDKEEVAKLLRNRNADINTTNVDGLSALHQACIDNNLEMVEFLVEHGASIDACDNEGWTPLHATASCENLDIARYLINHNANVAAVNNDGDLPYDIADHEKMQNLLQKEMDKKGIDADAARCNEEQRMLEDANQWLSDGSVTEIRHPKTGATALHVAAAKGYIKVINLLLEAGVDINAEDNDGWTPLHAAVYWEQEEACQILVNNLCDMEHKNKSGHTASDLAEDDMVKLLGELKKKQASIQKQNGKSTDIILSSSFDGKRSSATRLSGSLKENALDKKLPTLQLKRIDSKSNDTDHQNDQSKQGPQSPQQLAMTTIVSTSVTTVVSTSTKTTALPSRTLSEDGTSTTQTRRTLSAFTNSSATEVGRPSSVASSSPSKEVQQPTSSNFLTQGMDSPNTTDETTTLSPMKLRRLRLSKIDKLSEDNRPLTTTPVTTTSTITVRMLPTITASTLPSSSVSTSSSSSPSLSPAPNKDIDTIATGLSNKPLTTSKGDKICDLNGTSMQLQERLAHSRLSNSTGITSPTTTTTTTTSSITKLTTDTEVKSADRNVGGLGLGYGSYRSSFSGRSSTYVPYYLQRQQREAQAGSDNLSSTDGKSASQEPGQVQDANSGNRSGSVTSSSSSSQSPASTTTTTTASPGSASRRSYEPPKRDEETETQRKARAKYVRQTRRPTQGVSLDDIGKAEESINRDKNSSNALPANSEISSIKSSATKDPTSVVNGAANSTTTGTPTATTTTTVSSAKESEHENSDDKSIVSGYRRWASEDKGDTSDSFNLRGSLRRTRLIDRENSLSLNTSDSYVPRSQRLSASQTTDTASNTSSSQNLSQTKTNDEPKKDESSTQEKKEERKESTSLRARRQRRERRSTGPGFDNEGDNKLDGEDNDENTESAQDGSDPPVQKRRQTLNDIIAKYTEQTEIDYKKKFEEEKTENERLKKELSEARTGLQEVKLDLDRAHRQKDVRNSDREKRALEKKLLEMEEELKKVESLKADNQRLKDENGALIRVISKISKQVQ